MKLKIIKYGGESKIVECNSFEFRTNQVTNWIKVRKEDRNKELIHNICVIKEMTEVEESEESQDEN